MTAKSREFTPEDINILRDMCSELYSQYSEQSMDRRMNRRQQELARQMAGEVMSVWEKLPDDGFRIVPR